MTKQLVRLSNREFTSKAWQRANKLSNGFVDVVLDNPVLATFKYSDGSLIHATSESECRKWHKIPDVTFVGQGKWIYRNV